MTTLQNTKLVLRHPKSVIPNLDPSVAGGDTLAALARFFDQLAMGHSGGQPGDVQVEIHRGSTDAGPARATGTTTISGGTGPITATIGGVAIAITWATSDINSATLLAAAVNASADALVAGVVRACNLACTITLASVTAGQWVDIDGVRFTANAGANDHPAEFDISGNDTADAAALVAKVNNHPRLRDVFLASNSAGVVTLRQLGGTTGKHVYKEGAGITLAGLTSGLLDATATTIISSLEKTKLANHITLAASGTGHTASVARLAGGVGGDAAPKSFNF